MSSKSSIVLEKSKKVKNIIIKRYSPSGNDITARNVGEGWVSRKNNQPKDSSLNSLLN